MLEGGSFEKMCLDPARKKSARPWLFLLTAAVLAAVPATRAADLSWLDIESRIQYGYFTEDTRSLHNLVEPLGANDSHDRSSYYAGLLAYRLTLLAQAADQAAPAGKPAPVRRNDRSKNEARQLVERCVGSLDQALEVQSNFAEALALQSACRGTAGRLRRQRPEVPLHVVVPQVVVGPAFLGVDEVLELLRVAHEEDGRVVADHVVVTLLCIELDGEAPRVAVVSA